MRNQPWKPLSKRYLAAVGDLYGVITDAEPIVSLPEKKPRKRYVMRDEVGKRTEAQEQALLVKWLRVQGLLVHSIPNGGRRSVWTGERERTMGLLKGVCDLFLAEPSKGVPGYYIEMKAHGKKPRPEQILFMVEVRKRGYKAEWFDSAEAAMKSVQEYLDLGGQVG